MWWSRIIKTYTDLQNQLNALDVTWADSIKLNKQLASYSQRIKLATLAAELSDDLQVAKELAVEEDTWHDECKDLQIRLDAVTQEYEDLSREGLVNDSVLLEIRPGTGGQEAALFASSLFQMYKNYCGFKDWDYEVLNLQVDDGDGVREASIAVTGIGALKYLQVEAGVHRVQRVPTTESYGRVHTSSVTVAVLEESVESVVDIDDKYLRVDVYRSSGAGGQHVNTTDSAVRLTYEHPDLERITVAMQDERSQHKNKDKAMRVLRARVGEVIQHMQKTETTKLRRDQIGSGGRSEKIRTYNFPQNRLTDHRIKKSVYALNSSYVVAPEHLDKLLSEVVRSDIS